MSAGRPGDAASTGGAVAGAGLAVGLLGLLGVLAVGLGVPGAADRGALWLAVVVPVVLAGALLRSRRTWVVVGAAALVHVALGVRAADGEPARVVADVVVALVVLTLLGLVLTARPGAAPATDPATAVPGTVGPRGLEDAARRALAPLDGAALDDGASGDDEVGAGLLVAEVDHVAEIVDVHGSDAAEVALAHVARVLRAAVRPDDTVARLGGGQLAVLMPGVGPEAVALRGEALRRRVRDTPVPWAEGPLTVTVTFGVAHTASGHHDLDRLQAIARERLEAARRRGPGGDPAS